MKTIPLTQGQVALVDDDDYEQLSRHKWCAHRDPRCRTFYAVRRSKETGNIIKMHQVILGTKTGHEIDHQDSNGLNNQRGNLRFLPHQHNLMNSPKRDGKYTSQYKGVSYDKGRKQWAAYLWNKTRWFLGRFSTEEAAARAYDRAALQVYGEGIARLNFPVILPEEE